MPLVVVVGLEFPTAGIGWRWKSNVAKTRETRNLVFIVFGGIWCYGLFWLVGVYVGSNVVFNYSSTHSLYMK